MGSIVTPWCLPPGTAAALIVVLANVIGVSPIPLRKLWPAAVAWATTIGLEDAVIVVDDVGKMGIESEPHVCCFSTPPPTPPFNSLSAAMAYE